MNYKKLSYILLLLAILTFIKAEPIFCQVQELDIYNEWSCDDSNLNPERPFFIIRDSLDFQSFWAKTNFGGFPPHLDFDKYMVFVWAPGSIRKDCRKVEFEKLLYKDGCMLVVMSFEGYDKYMTGSLKKPIKAAIFPKIKSGDVFVFKKVITGWQKYELVPYYALWDMDNERKRPFEYVYIDKENKPLYQIATTTGNASVAMATTPVVKNETKPNTTNAIVSTESESKIYTPKMSQVSMPKELPEAQTLSSRSVSNTQTSQNKPAVASVQPVQPQAKPTPAKPAVQTKTTSEPINIGNTPAAKVDKDTKPEVAPGMGEDPLFGSEFDITF